MKNGIPNHVAIIMDGNGRWATRQGKKRTDGHYAGYKTLKNTALHILDKGVKYLSVFAFSTENFKRTEEEVNYLMDLFVSAFKSDKKFFVDNNIKVVFSGRKEPLSDKVWNVMKELEEDTKECTKGVFNVTKIKTVGISEADVLESLSFYPNPTSGTITFNCTDICSVKATFFGKGFLGDTHCLPISLYIRSKNFYYVHN